MNSFEIFKSPLGNIYVESNGNGITGVGFTVKECCNNGDKLTQEAIKQLDEYFKGKRRIFDLPLITGGTDFQKSVWHALTQIPYGRTVSYKDIAIKIGNPKAARAVGNANNKNPIAVIIPCHRVIGSNKSLTGYAFGICKKQSLIDLERKFY